MSATLLTTREHWLAHPRGRWRWWEIAQASSCDYVCTFRPRAYHGELANPDTSEGMVTIRRAATSKPSGKTWDILYVTPDRANAIVKAHLIVLRYVDELDWPWWLLGRTEHEAYAMGAGWARQQGLEPELFTHESIVNAGCALLDRDKGRPPRPLELRKRKRA